MKNFRKTLAYKICGYFAIIILIVTFSALLLVFCSVTMWQSLILTGVALWLFQIIPYIVLPIFILLSIIGLLTQKRYDNKKNNIIADIGYTIMCLLFLISLCSMHIQVSDKIAINKAHDNYQKYLQTLYPTVLNNSCQILYNELPQIINNLDINFDIKEFSEELKKIKSVNIVEPSIGIDNVFFTRYDNEDTFHHKGYTPEHIDIIRENYCNINKQNCYIKLKIENGSYECKYYYDNNKKVIPSEATIKLLNSK